MRRDEVVSLIESHVQNAGGNKRVAYENVGKQLYENIKSGKVRARSLSFRTLLEACLKEAGYTEVPWGESRSDAAELREAIGASSFPNITKYIIYSEIMPPYEVRKEELSSLFSEGVSSRSDIERIAGFTSAEGVELVTPQGTVQYTDFHEKYAEVRLDKFQRAIGLSKEAIYNDNTGQLIDRAASLGNKWSEQFEQMLIQTVEMRPRSLLKDESTSNLYCAKFNGTMVTNAIFYADTHISYAYMGSQVNDNLQTTALSTTGLEAALLLFASMKDESGDYIGVIPKTLLVHPNKLMTAWQLTKSPGQYDTANNASNPWGPGGMKLFNVVSSVYINTNTYWYLGDFKRQVKVLFWEQSNVITQGKESDQSFSNDIVMAWKFSVGCGAAHSDYRFVVNSQAST